MTVLHIYDEVLEVARVQWVVLFINRVNPAIKSLLIGRARAMHGIISLAKRMIVRKKPVLYLAAQLLRQASAELWSLF